MEQWKDIPGYEGIYQASNLGSIRTTEGKTTSSRRFAKRVWKQRIMRQKWTKNKYGRKDARVELWNGGKHKTFLVARLVAATFCDGYKEGMTVNHIDGDPANNKADNLEWVSRRENIQKAFMEGLYKTKAVRLTDQNDQYIEFPSMAACDRYLARASGYVSDKIIHGAGYVTDRSGETFKVALIS